MLQSPIILSLFCLSTLIASAASLTVVSPKTAGVAVLDQTSPYLSFTYYDWGPEWSGVDRAITVNEIDHTAHFTFHNKIQKTQTDFTISGTWSSPEPNQLRFEAELIPNGDSAIIMSQFGLKTGPQFTGSQVTVTFEDGSSTEHNLPFGRGELGDTITQLDLVDTQGAHTRIEFDQPVCISTDNEARIVLAKDSLQAGVARAVAFTLTLPEATQFIAGQTSAEPLVDISDWYSFDAPSPIPQESEWNMQSWLEKPAGKHGRITRTGGGLTYNGQPIKLWGLNNSYWACAPDQALADRRADFYAAMGINSVRLHKYADGTDWAGILSTDSAVKYDLEKLDRMDYYIAALKKRGIYTKLSPVFIIDIGPGDRERIPYMDELGSMSNNRINPKHGSLYVSTELQDLLIEQMVTLLKHKNPYTGLTYAKDAAIAYVELYNEDSALFGGVSRVIANSPTLRARTGTAFAQWLKKKYKTESAFISAWGTHALNSSIVSNQKLPLDESWDDDRIYPAGNPWFFDPTNLATSQKAYQRRLLDTMAYLYELQNEVYARYASAIRETGYAGELITSNWQAGRMMSHFYNLHSDTKAGTIDRHNYFGGGARGSGPINSSSMLAQPGSGLLSSSLQQVAGHPFMLSEWIHVSPNEWGVEGPAILGAYGMGLQDWDVSYAFQNSDNGTFSPSIGAEMWDVTAPQVIGIFPAVSRQVLRQDVAPSELVHYRNVHLPSLAEQTVGFDEMIEQAHDVKTINSDVFPAEALAVARGEVRFTETFESTKPFDYSRYQRDNKLIASTSQLYWASGNSPQDGHIAINTPGTQAIVGFANGQAIPLADATITSNSPYAAIYLTARSQTGKLSDDKAILLTAIARARNHDMIILNNSYLISPGKVTNYKPEGPVVMEPVRAEVSLNRNGTPTVHILDQAGVKTGRKLPVKNGKIQIDTGRDATPYYLIEY